MIDQMKVNMQIQTINEIKQRVNRWNNYRSKKSNIVNEYINMKRKQRSVEYILKHIELIRTVSVYMKNVLHNKK